VGNGKVRFAFKTALQPEGQTEFTDHLVKHGDGVKDVAFHVDDSAAIFEKAVSRGAIPVCEPHKLVDEEAGGHVILSTVKTYGDTTHTFVERSEGYHGVFLPGFVEHPNSPKLGPNNLTTLFRRPELLHIDHCVGNQPDGEMEATATWYEEMLDFHRFWSIDDKQLHTEYSSLRSVVVADYDERVKMPINEPADGHRKSQIQEYVDFYGGPGVQHIALRTANIVEAVSNMQARGCDFLEIPPTYYDSLRKRLQEAGITL
jgi:4-hydroxyphenylpyruvate dioxygenase